jgi:multidrug efflux system membrane fusion protein
MRSIEVNQIGGGTAVVDGGVSAGEEVVTAGQYRLQPGVWVAATSDGAPR